MATPSEEVGQGDHRFPAISVGKQIHFFMLDGAPCPIHHDVVVAASTTLPADPDHLCHYSAHEGCQCELAALIGMEDLGLTAMAISRATRQNFVSSLVDKTWTG
jgi:hypothetical protein